MSVSPLTKDGAPARPKAYALLDDPRVLGWGSIVLVLVVWELIARLFNVSALYLPRPSQIVVALVTLFGSGG
jgi:ABC-type nitrate/sulfonate/bicarbonate transport system permease component